MQVVHHCPEPPSVKAPHLPWWRIYALADPRTGDVRYVGITSKSLTDRLIGHLVSARRGAEMPVSDWIRELLNLGLKPTIRLLAETLDINVEAVFIEAYTDQELLLNKMPGGRRGSEGSPSPEARPHEIDWLIRAADAAEIVGIQRTHIHWLVQQGQLRGFYLKTKGQVRTGRLYIPQADLFALRERRQALGKYYTEALAPVET